MLFLSISYSLSPPTLFSLYLSINNLLTKRQNLDHQILFSLQVVTITITTKLLFNKLKNTFSKNQIFETFLLPPSSSSSPMRCKRHTVDHTSNIGVCSSCLRERLLYLAASAAIEEDNNHHHHNHNPKSNHNPPPLLIFPRSVSPYVTRRKSAAAVGGGCGGGGRVRCGGDGGGRCGGGGVRYGGDGGGRCGGEGVGCGGGGGGCGGGGGGSRRYIAVPQVDIGYSCKDFESNRSLKSKSRKLSRFSSLFRQRSEDSDKSETLSKSWISTILFTVRSKKKKPCYIEDVIAGRRPQRVFCRGMSPARDIEIEPEEEEEETPGRLERTPATVKTPGRRKSMSGMGFWLSPLVRASPNCPFKRKIKFPAEFVGVSGEVTVVEKPHLSEAASFCGNRSKKLVDLGRVNPRR